MSVDGFTAIRSVGFEPVGHVVVRELGADGVVVSAMTLRVRSDPRLVHAAATDHFAEAVTTGRAVARFAGRNKADSPASLAVVHLDAEVRQRGPGSPASTGPGTVRTALVVGGAPT